MSPKLDPATEAAAALVMQAIERVGRKLFGEYWIGDISNEELDLARKHRPVFAGGLGEELPADPKDAAAAVHAVHRAPWRQVDVVIHWLQHQCGLDLAVPRFDPETFNTFFAKTFGSDDTPLDAGAATAARKAAVRRRLPGAAPGRIAMKAFTALINSDCGGTQWSARTIKRDLAELRQPRKPAKPGRARRAQNGHLGQR
jgi:hypothetical protein